MAVPFCERAQAQTDPLNFAGDFRVRHEITTRQEPGNAPDVLSETRNREVVRFRFGINRKINGLFNFGARLATGSPDDPNTTDITMGDFFNDLTISLDRAYMEMRYKNLFVTGGKFANPYLTTELVWDGDVNLQGFGVSYTFAGLGKITPKLTGVYSIIDEQTIRDDSYLKGGQVELGINASSGLNLKLGGGYYDYTINSLVNAGSGDILSNRLNADRTGYLSDFDLLDIVATVDAKGFGQRYPLRFVGNYVNNMGADDQNTGFGVDLFVGQASKKKDLRFVYGYAQTETDAVLAAFAHDNTTLSTNYDQHTLAADYVVVDNTILNVTWYYYRTHEVPAGSSISNDFFSRVRLNAMVRF
ncbi:MAG: putative porin [bacterium]